MKCSKCGISTDGALLFAMLQDMLPGVEPKLHKCTKGGEHDFIDEVVKEQDGKAKEATE